MEPLQSVDLRLLSSYGVSWIPRSLAEGVVETPPPAGLDEVAERVESCVRCGLAAGRNKSVFGDGPAPARLMFVGEGPGEEEDRQGLPFVGKAGQLLTKMLEALGLRRKEVYIANVVKCRPPRNRDPLPEEALACLPYLMQQIAAVDPEVIVTLGRVPTNHLLGSAAPIQSVRGKVLPFEQRRLVPTYHPSYLLRFPARRWETWEDMKVVLGLLGLPLPPNGGRGS